jgi:hypothetical protein
MKKCESPARGCRRLSLVYGAVLCAAYFGGATPSLSAQSTINRIGGDLNRAGFGLYDLSAFSSFSSSTRPVIDATTGVLNPNFNFQSLSGGVSTSLGWRSRKTKNFHLSAVYGASYYYQHASNGFSQSRFAPRNNFDLNWGRSIGTKWTVNWSLSGALGNYDQLLLLPTDAQGLAGTPGSAADFSSAILSGTGGNVDLIAAATGAYAFVGAQQNLLYGNRFLTLSTTASVGYAATPRLSIGFSAGTSRMQHLGGDDGQGGNSVNLIPQTTGLYLGLSVGYALSPRTNFSLSGSYSLPISRLGGNRSAGLNADIGRTLTPHLFVRGGAGAGYILPHGSGASGTPLQRTGWQAEASVGYRLFRQSFVASVSRSVSDYFGLNASATIMAGGGWSWSPPGSSWSISAGAHDTRLQGSAYGRDGYNVNAGVNRRLGSRAHASLSYGYGAFSAGGIIAGINPTGAPLKFNTHSVSLHIGFRPFPGHLDADPGNPSGGDLQNP